MDKPTIEQIIIETKREAAWRERDRCLAVIDAFVEISKDKYGSPIIKAICAEIKSRIEAGK